MGAGRSWRRRTRVHDRGCSRGRGRQHRRDLRARALLLRPRRSRRAPALRQRLRRAGHGRERGRDRRVDRGIRARLPARRRLVLRRILGTASGALRDGGAHAVRRRRIPHLCAGVPGGGKQMKAALGRAFVIVVCPFAVLAEGPIHTQGTYLAGYGLERPPQSPPAPPWQAPYQFYWTPAPPDPTQKPAKGAEFKGQDPDAPTLTVADCKLVTPKGGVTVRPLAWRCNVRSDKRICSGNAVKDIPVVLVAGHWSNARKWEAGDWTASCSVDDIYDRGQQQQTWTGVLAKCLELWHMNVDEQHVTACIHMARADYDGDGKSDTVPGTPVDAWDVDAGGSPAQHDIGCKMIVGNSRKYGGQQDESCSMWVEAMWDELGAICVNNPRYQDLQLAAGSPNQKKYWHDLFAKAKLVSLDSRGVFTESKTMAIGEWLSGQSSVDWLSKQNTSKEQPSKEQAPEQQVSIEQVSMEQVSMVQVSKQPAPRQQPSLMSLGRSSILLPVNCYSGTLPRTPLIVNRSAMKSFATGWPLTHPKMPRTSVDPPECVALCADYEW